MSGIESILGQWASKEGIQFVDSEAERQFEERAQRIATAIQLKVPDRIPIAPNSGFFPLTYTGISLRDAMRDYDKAYTAWRKTIADFKWDAAMPPITNSEKILEIMKFKQCIWPGHGLKDDAKMYQFVEPGQKIKGEVSYDPMKIEEYDWFIEDPSDYIIRAFLPRISEALKPFSNIYPLHGISFWGRSIFTSLAGPNFDKAFLALAEAAREANKWYQSFVGFLREIKNRGFPIFTMSGTTAPFDRIANYFRGTREIFTDIFRIPDKVKAACERVTPFMIDAGISSAKATNNPIVLLYLHKGAFMNINQYKEFYWPTLKKVLVKLIDNDLIPYVYTEGDYTRYLEVIRDMPKGKIIYHVEKDIFKAKEILGDKFCLTGGLPASKLYTSSSQEIKEYCKKAFEELGEGGGFILDADAALAEARPENLKAVNEAILKYGTYKK